MIEFAAIALCGSAGAILRAFTMDKLREVLPISFPWPTMIVNIVACILIGAINAHSVLPAIQAMACTGFLGGFSTMSTLNDDAINLLKSKKTARFVGYMAGSYGCCLIGCLLGYYCM